jgi:hypothetical protein
MLILLIEKYPFGTYNILLWSFNQRPHFIALEVFNSSCIATTQSGSHSASSTLKGSKEETNE